MWPFRFSALGLSLSYATVWSFISIYRYITLRANAWDLGYLVFHIRSLIVTHWTITGVITQLAYQGDLFLLTPLAYANSITSILIFQSVMLGLPAYIFFEITLHKSQSGPIALLISLSYVLYFPLAGVNWQDAQIMNMFAFLFSLGYLLYLKNHYLLASIVLLVSGLVRFPLMLLVIAAFLSLSLPVLTSLFRRPKRQLSMEEITALIILVLSLCIFAFQYFWISATQPSLILTHASYNHDPFIDLTKKLFTILLLLGPLLFLPLFSKKWIIPIISFFVIIFFFNNSIYEFPELFMNWYSILVIPFLFLGLIDFLTRKSVSVKQHDERVRSPRMLNRHLLGSSYTSIKLTSIFVVVLLIALALFLQPYGPLNKDSFNNFNLFQNEKKNLTLFNDANSVINLMPANASYVLVQNDLPQVFLRSAIKEIIVSPYGIGPNVTNEDVAKNLFPYYGSSGGSPVPINYVLTNINDPHSLNEPSMIAGYPTMMQMDEMLINSSYYGIVAENNGVVLMERGYVGPLKMFVPYSSEISLKNMIISNGTIENGEVLINGSVSNITERTPFITLFPGLFSINVTGTLDCSSSFSIWLEDGYYNTQNQFVFLNKIMCLNGSSSVHKDFNIRIPMDVTNFIGNAQCFLVPYHFNGNLTINSITVNQVS